jgi:DNA-binding response OmpR family regulator
VRVGRLSLENVDVLIYDPVSANRTATRAAMYSLGFRLTETVATLDAFVDAVQKRPPDIALCEAQGAADELCRTIQQLRQGTDSYNPFLVIIVTCWEKSTGLINKVVSSGADDLILRPFSTALLSSRIESHIERRKSFVITTDYVGPDRRSDPNRPNSADLFDPPNSLKLKAKDKLSIEAVQKKLDADLRVAREKLHGEKLRRDSFQVCILWRMMQDQRPGASGNVDLDKLSLLTRSIERRCQGTEYEAGVAWCESITAATEGLKLNVDRNASMHLLGHAALTLHQIFYPEKSAAEQLAEIDATVAIIRARNQTAMAS